MMIELRHAALTYQTPEGEVEAVRDVSFAVAEGEFVSLVGPSGCGKSTLLSAVAGLLPLTDGEIRLDGRTVTAPGRDVGLMPQQDQLFEWLNIRDNVTLWLRLRRTDTAENRAYVQGLLERYGLADFADKRPSRLSGGMRQRCSLIRTLAAEPKVLLLDEPFSALDYQTRLRVSEDIYRIIRQQHKTALLVTHDISEAIRMSDRIVVLSRRPATVQRVYELEELRSLNPAERRHAPAYQRYFNSIWKELDGHE